MYDSDAILVAAREIRGELSALLGDQAEAVRRRLDELLAAEVLIAADGSDDRADAILQLLAEHDAARAWMRERLQGNGAESLGNAKSVLPGTEFGAEFPASVREAYALIEAPSEVTTGVEFAVVVGLTLEADSAVASSRILLPDDDLSVTMHVTADGIELRPGQRWRHELSVTRDGPLPSVKLAMIADAQEEDVREARIQVMFMIGGHPAGFGSRGLLVVKEGAARPAPTAPTGAVSGVMVLPTGEEPPDLMVEIRHGATDGELMWIFDTAHDLRVPDAAEVRSIGLAPDRFARNLITGANMREGQPDLFAYLRGVGHQVAEKIPDAFFALLAEVAVKTTGPPTVQLLSEEPYVPWELAWVDPPLDPQVAGFLATQAVVGRWVLGQRRPPLPPPDTTSAAAIAVIWGEYTKPGWKRLKAAEEEGKRLSDLYGATHVDARINPVMRCIEGDPDADVLHFALHGNYDPDGTENGLMLVDQRALDPTVVSGMSMPGKPFVFLNACQVGAGQKVLGDYAGLAQAFLSAGACAVVAPLWSVSDVHARDLALRFYEQVLAGARPAEVLRHERAGFGPSPELETSAHFAYQFFGHPAMTLASTLAAPVPA